MSAKRYQPKWQPPNIKDSTESKFTVLNSLTRSKVPFKPIDGENNHVSWYNCGPTVYDHSHMGHARSYICIDILRRIVTDYFNYNVTFSQGLTDIDDKIILRARQNYLFDKFLKSPPSDWESFTTEALNLLKSKLDNETDPDKRKMLTDQYNKCNNAQNLKDQNERINNSKDCLVLLLDKKLGSTVTDNSIFWDLPRFFEADYWNDMDRLNVRRPTVQIRVSECVPEIVTFIEKIIENGYAYESQGSVYFDVGKYNDSDDHFYAKLEPENMGNMELVEDGEGKLASTTTEKKSPNDFALWKKSKPGEPTWSSPWSEGRPGWHIECSVMSNIAIGGEFDIHTGGVDLKFPHHDNEIAQSEAHFNKDHWCNYFMHSGHLHINGCKMSKSLKNFITIKEALERYGPRKLRLAFLMHNWYATLDYSDKTFHEVENLEKSMTEFFLNTKDFQRKFKQAGADRLMKPDPNAIKLMNDFEEVKRQVHVCLSDNFNTVGAIQKFKDLVSIANIYTSNASSVSEIHISLLEDIAKYLTKMFKIFGVIADNVHTEIGFESDVSAAVSGAGNGDSNDSGPTIQDILDVLSNYREEIRNHARSKDLTKILKECDNLRDDILPEMGIRLEDTDKGARVKVVGREQAMAEKEARLKELQAKEEKKRLAAVKKEKEKQEKNKKNSIPENEMFKLEEHLKLLKLNNFIGKFSKFDEESGKPTHEKCEKSEEFPDGDKPLSKKALKNVDKAYENQRKNHKCWREEQLKEHGEWLEKN